MVRGNRKSRSPCVTCGNSVSGDSIACDSCNQWCHGTEACTGLPTIVVDQIIHGDGKRIRFICHKCESSDSPSSSGNTDQVNTLMDTVNKLFQTVADLTSQVTTLTAEVRELRSSLATNTGGAQSAPPCSPAQMQVWVREEMKELHEREKRKDSIIIRGIPAPDIVPKFSYIVKFLCPKINCITLTDIVTLKPHLVRCKIVNQQHRSDLLSQCKKLAGSQFSAIYITRDLTFKQRKDLREKRAVRATSSGGGATALAADFVASAASRNPPEPGPVPAGTATTPDSATPNRPLPPSNLTPGSVRDRVASLQAGL